MSNSDSNPSQHTTGKYKPIRVLTLEVSPSGVLVQCPVYETHKRGRNWFAEIEPNLHTGDLNREFWTRNRYGGYYVVPNDLPNRLPVPIEIGGDYIASGRKRLNNRFYGVITDIQTDGDRIAALVVEEYETGLEAIERARELKAQQVARALGVPLHQIGAMQEELHKLLQVCRLLPTNNTAVVRLCLNLENALQALDEIQSDTSSDKKI